MKKSIFALFLLILSAFCFVGCGQSKGLADFNITEKNAFRIIRQADDSGKVALSYIFPVNCELLQQQNFSESEIKTYRFYLSTFVNALAKQNRDKNVVGVSVSNCTYFTDVDGLGFSIVFENLDAQKRFFGEDEKDPDKPSSSNTKISGFFVRKVEFQTSFPISENSAKDLRQICEMAISSCCKDNNISSEKQAFAIKQLESAKYIYDFATTQKQLKSETMYDDQNFHHNLFVKTSEQLKDNKITFYTTYANTPVWYATALCAVILGMTISYFVLKDKKKETKKQS